MSKSANVIFVLILESEGGAEPFKKKAVVAFIIPDTLSAQLEFVPVPTPTELNNPVMDDILVVLIELV